MNHISATLVTTEPARVESSPGGTTAFRFGTDDVFTVILAQTMTPDATAAWCLGFAKDLTDLAAQIMQDATVTA